MLRQNIHQKGDSMKTQIVNHCNRCGINYTVANWQKLQLVSRQLMTDGNLPSAYELRNCPCGSTLAIGQDSEGNFCEDKTQ
jgi:hypothetical protein